MLLPIRIPRLPPMPRHIPQYLHPHRALLAISQKPIPIRIGRQRISIELRHLPRIHGDQLILLVPVAYKPCLPLSAGCILLPEETEPAVSLGVDFAPVEDEPLRDGRFHLCYRARRVRRDVCRGPVHAVHDEGAGVHAALRGADEVLVEGAARPGRVDVGIWVKDGSEVFPFAGVAICMHACNTCLG